MQACLSTDHSADELPPGPESQKTAVADKAEEDNEKNPSCFDTEKLKHWHQSGKHFVRCETCLRNISTVKLFIKKQLPAIVQECGVLYRTRTVENHNQTDYHKAALKSNKLQALPHEKIYEKTPMGIMISNANEKLANKMGTLMLQAYNDAKKLTLSAYSWPSRVVAAQIASEFIFNDEQREVKLDLQYISPAYHRELLQVVVDSHRQTLANTIKEALASSLSCDGSVDRTQVEKIFTMLKIIDKDADKKLLFVGAKEPEKTGAAGCLNTLKDSCIETEAGMEFSIIQEISSIVNDGTNMNSGERDGLWVLLEKLRLQQAPDKESLIPLIKMRMKNFYLLEQRNQKKLVLLVSIQGCIAATLHGNPLRKL